MRVQIDNIQKMLVELLANESKIKLVDLFNNYREDPRNCGAAGIRTFQTLLASPDPNVSTAVVMGFVAGIFMADLSADNLVMFDQFFDQARKSKGENVVSIFDAKK